MATTAFILTIASSLFWGFFDVARKSLSKDIPTVILTFLLVAGQIPFYMLWAIWGDGLAISQNYWLYGASCAAVNLYANVAFIQSVKMSELSLSIPMLTLTPVFAALIAYFTLDEVLTTKQIVGILLVFIGSLAIHADAFRHFVKSGKQLKERSQLIGILLMTSVALSWAATSSLDKLSMEHAPAASHACVQCALISLALFLYIRIFRRKERTLNVSRKSLNIYMISLIVAVLALGMQLLAIQQAHVGLVEATKRSSGVILAIIMGWIFFKEKVTALKVVTSSIIVAGLWMLLKDI